jgi:hypothetical protein
MLVATRRYHVALVDPIPAGLEALNAALAVTGSVPQDPNDKAADRWWWWRRPWFEHTRTCATNESKPSRHWFGTAFTPIRTWLERRPGAFIVPPAKSRRDVPPETFGRSGTDRVIVE